MVAHYTLTVYQADDVTPWFAVSTDPAHPHPYLHPPGEYDQGEIDLLGGRALVGEIQVRVIDPQTGADQSERWLTALLGIPADQEGAGHSALNGRRGLLTQSDGAVVLDGVVSGVRLSETFAGFHLGLRDIRERHRRVSLFGRTGTATVLPRGVLNGYGKLPGGGWLIPPTKPLPAVYRGTSTILGQSGYFDLSGLWTGRPLDGSRTATAPAVLVLTDSMRQAATTTMVGDVVPLPVYRNIEVWWRRTSGDTSWHIITDIRPRGASPHPLLLNHVRARVEGVDGEVEAIHSIGVAGGGFAGPPLDVPNDGESVEVLVLYVGPPTEDYPYHWEGPAGELLAALYDGTYSEAPITDRVDPATIAALTTPVRLRLTEAPQADRSREWIEHVYRQLRAAPALDRSGRISPVTAALPDPSEVLVELTDDVCQPIPGWDHPAMDAVTAVRITYPRDYRVPVEDDPLGERSAGDGLASIDVTVERRAPEWVIDLMGEQVHEIDGFLFRALGIVGSAGTIDPASGDITDETGHLEATRAAREILDRWVFGGQVSFARVMRSALPDLRPGQWVIDRRSWRPNYREGKRGGESLAQIMSVRAVDPAWLEISMVDAGPTAQPLTPPAIGTPTVSDDGVITVPVTSIPPGGETAVYYAVATSAPAWGSGEWRLAGRVGQAGDVHTPPQPAGARVWITARGEGLGRRPSSPLSPVSITVTATPRVRDVRLVIADDGTPTVSWTPNVAAAGVRVYYATHALEDPEPDPVTYLDADASAGELVLPTVPLGRVLTIEVEPWTGYSGGAVGGTPGARVRLSRLYASSAALLVEYSGPAPGENVSADFDPDLHAYMRQSVDGGVSWTLWARIVGEDGEPGKDGRYTDYIFRASASQPATPTGTSPAGWSDAPPSVPAGEFLWMSRAVREADGTLVGTWSTPVRLTGEKGDPGSVTPICNVVPWEWTPSVAEVRITGTDGEGGTGGLEYRHRAYLANATPPAWSSWLSLPSAGVTRSYPVDPRWDLVVEAQVRIAADPTRESTIGSTRIPAVQPGISDGGRPLADELEAGTLPDDVLIGGMRPPIIAQQVSSPSQNLLGPDAGPERAVAVGAPYTLLDRVPLDSLGLAPGDVVSWSCDARGEGGAIANMTIAWHADNDSVIRYDNVPGVEGGAYERHRVENRTIPVGAAKARVYFENKGAGGTAHFRRAMLNRGPIALPYEPPPLRPDRETIDDLPDGQQHRRTTHAEADGGGRAYDTIEPGGGVLKPGVAGSDGATPKLLAKGLVHGMCWNGMAIQYEQPYQNTPPVVIYQGPTDDERNVWYPSLEQAIAGTGTPGPRPSPARIRQMFIADASPSGFTPRLVLVALGTPTPRSTTFASPILISLGGASGAATPSAAQTPALGDQYDADYTCTVQRPRSLIGDVQLVITLAIEVSLNGGAWVEVMTKQVTLWLFDDQDEAQVSGSIRFTAAIAGGNDQVRLRFKDLVMNPPASPPPSPAVSADLLRWNQDADVRYANATPDGEADAIPFVVLTQG